MDLQTARIEASRRTLRTGTLYVARRATVSEPFKVVCMMKRANDAERINAQAYLDEQGHGETH